MKHFKEGVSYKSSGNFDICINIPVNHSVERCITSFSFQ
jgi:hypothetical protein